MPEPRRTWNTDELILALSLYRQLPFGQMHSRNHAVTKLAEVIDRTPSAVAMKLVNFASFDPTLQARGIKGMGNSSKLDREVWNRFATQWDALATALPETVEESIELDDVQVRVTEVKRLQRVRVGQSFFRNAVLSAYDMKCCITGISEKALLRASHIVPWASSEAERLNPANGLCLNAIHDAAFDRGLMTLDESLRVVVSAKLPPTMSAEVFERFFGSITGQPIRLPDRTQPHPEFLAHHRTNIFVQA